MSATDTAAKDLPGRMGETILVAAVVLVPLTLWIGFADNFEVPKLLILTPAVLALMLVALVHSGRRPRLFSGPLDPALAAFAGSAVASSVLSGSPGLSWAGEEGSWMGGAAAAVLPLAACAAGPWLDPGVAKKTARAALAAAVAVIAYMAVQVAGLDPFPWDPRLMAPHWLFASLGNPVHLGNYLACSFWLSVAVLPARNPYAWGLRLALLAGIAVLLARGQMSGALGLTFGGALFLAIRLKTGRPAMTTGVVVAAALGLLALLGPGERPLGARVEIWKAAGRMLRSSPVLGTGPGLFYTEFPYAAQYGFFAAEPPVVRGSMVNLRMPASAHNEAVNVLAAQGVLGLGLFFWILILAWRIGRDHPLAPAALSLLAVHLTNPPSVPTALIFWLLLAAVGSSRIRRLTGPVSGSPLVWAAGTAVILVLLAATLTQLKTAVAQSYRREAGRLLFFGESERVKALLGRWSGYAARAHPKQAYADAGLLQAVYGEEWHRPDNAGRIAELWAAARAGNPRNLFFGNAYAFFELERGRRTGDTRALDLSEAVLRAQVAEMPAVLSLNDDLAEVLEAKGRTREAELLRARRRELDVRGVFSP